MKFSVLLPTRNRLELLKYAVETVRRQDYDNWEVIISDNFSDEDIAGYVRSLNDPRVKYYRTESFIPVTDNWNNALDKSDGDYVIMLGDDDCLMKGYFSILYELIKQYDNPDFIYTGALQFVYPGVFASSIDGMLYPACFAKFIRKATKPFLLDKKTALEMVNHSLNFRIRFNYNAQFCLISRKLLKSLEKYGKFYQSPYPDYYSANVLMLKAERILITPQNLVTVGISPKSFGFYYFNNLEKDGNLFLKNIADPRMARRLENIVLPGTDMNTSTLFAMETIRVNFGVETPLKVNYAQYRLLQIGSICSKCLLNIVSAKSEKKKLWQKMNIREKLFFGFPLSLLNTLSSYFPSRSRRFLANLIDWVLRVYPRWFRPRKIPGNYKTILDVFEHVDPVNIEKSRK